MAKGDHLIVSRGFYSHHAIDLGNGKVVQYGSRIDIENACVEIVSMETFLEGSALIPSDKLASYSPDEIIKRAMSRLGEKKYNLYSNNCEHFVNWCRTGKNESRQVERIKERLASTSFKVAGKFIAKNSAKIATKAATRAATPWLIVSDIAQAGTEIVSSNIGVNESGAEVAGQTVGAVTSIGIGALAGGPIGAAVGAGVWLFGEIIGKTVTKLSN